MTDTADVSSPSSASPAAAQTRHWPLGGIVPVALAILYPLLLNRFHEAVGEQGEGDVHFFMALLYFLAFMAVPLIGLLFAWRIKGPASQRRLAYACVAAPTLYVLLGVTTYMFKAEIADEVLWTGFWLGLLGVAWVSPGRDGPDKLAPGVSRWRVVHGVTAVLIVIYVAFHLFNHLTGWFGNSVHTFIRHIGGFVYRAPVIEPLLVIAFLFQAVTGTRLFWRWSSKKLDFYRTVQVATGAFLVVFIIGHMNSVFTFARSYLEISSDFDWASGGDAGLIHDPWNIRLLPHYYLGVMAVLVHLLCGWRHIVLKHGHSRAMIDRFWWLGVAASFGVATLIVLGMLIVG